jgi:hypothetical protein
MSSTIIKDRNGQHLAVVRQLPDGSTLMTDRNGVHLGRTLANGTAVDKNGRHLGNNAMALGSLVPKGKY